jgi:hypothetical protein
MTVAAVMAYGLWRDPTPMGACGDNQVGHPPAPLCASSSLLLGSLRVCR